MYIREITSEDVLARKQLRRAFESEREIRTSAIKPKLLGVVCIILCIVCPTICDGDCTICFVLIPCAIYFFTRR